MPVAIARQIWIDTPRSVVANTPAEFRAAMKADVERWKAVIEKNAIKLD